MFFFIVNSGAFFSPFHNTYFQVAWFAASTAVFMALPGIYCDLMDQTNVSQQQQQQARMDEAYLVRSVGG